MDRRTFLAILLTAIVVVVTPLLFPSGRPSVQDTARVVADSVAAQGAKHGAPPGAPNIGKSAPSANQTGAVASPRGRDTVVQRMPRAALAVSTLGAAPVWAELSDYRNLNPHERGTPVILSAGNELSLLSYRLTAGGEDLALDSLAFGVSHETNASTNTPELLFRSNTGARRLSVAYAFPPDGPRRYVTHVTVRLENAPTGTALQVALPRRLVSAERDTLDDDRHLAIAFKPLQKNVENRPFTKLDSGTIESIAGPQAWVGVRNKYFLVAVLAPPGGISNLKLEGQPKGKDTPPRLSSVATLVVNHDTAGFDLYTGPQEFERLRNIGSDLDQVNPYAGWTHSVVQPFATLVTRVLLWMKSTTGLGYGWVIVIFGVVIRILLWPLNQSAMRTSMRMQRLQPELAEVQARYKSDPEKQREALVKLYAAHGMSPLSPVMGCLPMLLPMPIILALYFVFQNTIEFRGVSFLWLPDISVADPYYITPLLMGASMFVLSWVGMRGTPPTPQTKAMSYMMPVVLTVLFYRFAAGLNLYYAVQNVAALPQQWLLSRERLQTSAAAALKKPART